MNKESIEAFFSEQLAAWPEAAERYQQLQNQEVKYIRAAGKIQYRVVCNPARSVSVTANTTQTAVCPLCGENRPEAQTGMLLPGGYTLLVNPYPIFHKHFTIPANDHLPQEMHTRFTDLLVLAKELEGYTVFYNGPEAGASMPQHVHFQAVPFDELPPNNQHDITDAVKIIQHRSATMHLVYNVIPHFQITARNDGDASTIFERLYNTLDDKEKRKNNILARYVNGEYQISIYLRQKHRPDAYYCEDSKKIVVSPAAAEMGGTIVTIDPGSYEKINREVWEDMLREISISPERMQHVAETVRKSPKPCHVNVGILETPTIEFNLLTPYTCNGKKTQGLQKVELQDDQILYNGETFNELLFIPCSEENARIRVSGVTIGKEFHWQQHRTQEFTGSWRILPAKDKLVGINILDMEEYLKSVVSSEMSANAPLELLKAHAMIARSWLIRMIEKGTVKQISNGGGLIWHEAEEHTLYDVCADDHCQRYQGITQITNPAAVQAVEETRGKIIAYKGEVIDARYSKCCGGATEEFSTAWGNIDYPYLPAVYDTKANTRVSRNEITGIIDKWTTTSPAAWCNVSNPDTIRMIMNDYDRKTADFYRWTVDYTACELSAIIYSKTGIDPGELLAIEALERGSSGRIWKLRITGSLNTRIVGKELEIRRALSPTHLYSSAFTIETQHDELGKPVRFILHGAGWGHGVGLCQIGAANMAAHGYTSEEIISHYYKETDIIQKYE